MRHPLALLLLPLLLAACGDEPDPYVPRPGSTASGLLGGIPPHPADSSLHPVAPDDPMRDVLEDERRRQRDAFADASDVTFGPWRRIEGPAIARLFPDDRFYALASERPATDWTGRTHPEGLPLSGYVVVAVDGQGRRHRFPFHGNYQEYGAFLADQGIHLGDETDAAVVWSAFLEVHRKAWEEGAHRLVAPGRWHLNEHVRGDVRYSYAVETDDEGRVVSARLRADDVP